MNELLTPLNHREIEYNAKRLSGCNLPDSFLYENEKARELFDWISQTGDKVFDDDLRMDYGTDCLRLYLLFEHTPKEHDAPFYESWNEGALEGMYKFLSRYRRMVLAAYEWNRRGGYNAISEESIKKMQDAFGQAGHKIEKCIMRENTMPNRHNLVSALMELLNVLQKELKIGEIVTNIRQHAIDTAAPKKAGGEKTDSNTDNSIKTENVQNSNVTRLCREFIMLMAPIACDLSKMLWKELASAL